MLKDDAAILPRIVAIGDIDEDEIAFAEAATGDIAADALALPEALGGMERRLLLAQLIRKWATSPELHGASGAPLIAQTPAAACALADDLARLIDDMTTRGVPWERLDDLVPEEHDKYWQLTLRFLQIARRTWPAVLDERNRMEPIKRRDALIKAEAARLARKIDAPVIAAGSTGSIPATAELIATIARLPHGAVVLPGLDIDLDEESWKLIAGDEKKNLAPVSGHPQFAMQALLTRIGIGRDAVTSLAEANGREWLSSEALRPAAATDMWRQKAADPAFEAHVEAALRTLTVIEAANAEDEALAIAVALREAVHDGKTAALVTSGPRARTPRAGRARALEYRGRGFRRRCIDRYTCRNFCAARGRGWTSRLGAGGAAGAPQTSAAAARCGGPGARGRHARARDPARAASARPEHTAWPMRSRHFARAKTACIAPTRATP